VRKICDFPRPFFSDFQWLAGLCNFEFPSSDNWRTTVVLPNVVMLACTTT
jgi:hypothetical protein